MCTLDSNLPLYLWEHILTQVAMNLNMLRQSWMKPALSVYKKVEGVNSSKQLPPAPLVFKEKIIKKHISDVPKLITQLMVGISNLHSYPSIL